MTTLLEQAIKALRDLPQAEQKLAAAAVIDYAQRDDLLELSEDDTAEVRHRIASGERNFLSLDDVRGRIRFDA